MMLFHYLFQVILSFCKDSLHFHTKNNIILIIPNHYSCFFSGIKVTVTSDYEAEEDDELTLHQGEILVVLEQPDAVWWLGYKEGRLGYFPSRCVQVRKVTFFVVCFLLIQNCLWY